MRTKFLTGFELVRGAHPTTLKVFKKFGHAIQQQKGWEEIPVYVADWLKK